MNVESGERYEVVVKHDVRGVLHKAGFKNLGQAHAFLRARWGALPNEWTRDMQCGGVVYDTHDSRKRVIVLGADYLTDEGRGDKGA
jgi:hypothetical protein